MCSCLLIAVCAGGYCLFRRRPQASYRQNPTYTVKELPGFLTSEQCDEIIAVARRKGLIESRVYKSKQQGSKEDLDTTVRKSQQAWLASGDSPAVRILKDKVANITGFPVSNQEELQVVSYQPGGKFDAHYDACVGEELECRGMNENGGPRYITVLIYLNDGYTGGTTSFPNIGKTVTPQKGKAILFYDIDLTTKEIIPESIHSGDPLITGEKWVGNIWIHLEPRRR